jgi:hypothetical protein
MPDEEETRLHTVLTDCHGVSIAAGYALRHAVLSVANNRDAYQQLVSADAAASLQYTDARIALRTYRMSKKLI